MDYTVSIIVPTYNAEHTIKKCIGSLIKQTYKNIEIIVVDDCSTDNTILCLQGIKDGRIVTVLQKENAGVSDARNVGLKKASGNIITFCDSDDWVEPDYVETLVESMDTNDFVSVGYFGDWMKNGELWKSEGCDLSTQARRYDVIGERLSLCILL